MQKYPLQQLVSVIPPQVRKFLRVLSLMISVFLVVMGIAIPLFNLDQLKTDPMSIIIGMVMSFAGAAIVYFVSMPLKQ
jgi:hypothetical protein